MRRLGYWLGGGIIVVGVAAAVGTVEIVRPGRFRFESTTSSDAGGELAVGRTLGRKLVATVVGGLLWASAAASSAP